ncbi:hypothetical protein TI39_contig4162g00008 [Zymoseptoria brevis]|uniref:Amidase domain-containing protein n=1 Tax=Zymoseptoria brevis TaxID=1047168 RepID=A0A0F4GBG9_9PEZI|nr:hypothetical protein TI39_contig4162g00008 [Zymoseptoria brevis]
MKFQYATWLSFALSLQGTLAQSTQYPSLTEATLDELAAGLESGAWTSVDLVKAYIARIQEVNGALHAVAQINPDALDIAALPEFDCIYCCGSARLVTLLLS